MDSAEADSNEPYDPFNKSKSPFVSKPEGATTFIPRVVSDSDSDVAEVTYTGHSPALVFISGSSAGSVFELDYDKDRWMIGSGVDQDIKVSDSGVSASHAILERDGVKWILRDQMSKNDTYVNQERVTYAYLSNESVLEFGGAKCRFYAGDGKKAKNKKQKKKPLKTQKSGKDNNLGLWLSVIAVIVVLAVATVSLFMFSDLSSYIK